MKLRAILMAAAVATAVFASTRVVSAQQLTADVPFGFAAGAANLPAGEYTVTPSEANGILVLTNRDNPKISVMIPAHAAASAGTQTQSKLVFNRYGDRYFLSQVWTAGNSTGKELSKSAREKESAMSAKADTRDQVILYASLR
jgi:hypothetical protein